MNENDGSLIFDTELDTEGFEAGSEKIEKAVRDLISTVESLGNKLIAGFAQLSPTFNNIATQTAEINSKLNQTVGQAENAGERIAETENQTAEATQHATEEIDKQSQSMSSWTGAVTNASGSVSALGREVNSLSAGMQTLATSAENGFSNGNAVLSFDSKLTDMQAKIDAAHDKLQQFADADIPTAKYLELSSNIQKAEKALLSLYDKRDALQDAGVSEFSKEWKNVEKQISAAEMQLKTYEKTRNDLVAHGERSTKGANTDEYARMKATLDETSTKLENNRKLIDSEALSQARLNVQAAQEKVIRASTDRQRITAMEELSAAQQQLHSLANSISTQGQQSAPNEETVSGWQRFGQTLRDVAAAGLHTAAMLGKLMLTGVAKGFQAAANGVKKFTTRLKQTSLTSNSLVKSLTSLKTLLKTRLKRMFISAIFSSAKESINSLAKFSSEFDAVMSNIKNRSKELSANLSVSLGGLISVIEPFVTRIASAFSSALTHINAFFAALSGKSTVIVAKKQTDSYADSLDGAAGSAEELKRQVYGFDELNKRSDNSSSGSSNGSDLFEEVPIESALTEGAQKFFNNLLDAFKNGDWYGVGEIVAGGLNSIIARADDWINNVLRPTGVLWVERFAEILNGMVAGFDWNLAGKTVADGLNAVFDIIHTFLTKFDFEKLGTGIGAAINGFFANVEWDLIGQTFAARWNALVNLVYGIVTETDWALVGDSCAEFVENLFDTFNFDKLGDTLSTGINGIVTMLQHFFDGVDFPGLASDLASGINKLVSGIDWSAAGKMLSDGVKGLLDFIVTSLEEIDWQQIGRSLKEFLVAVDWNGIIEGISEGIGALLGGLSAILWEMIRDAWNAVVQWWQEHAYEDGQFTIEGLLNGIWEGIKDIGAWIKEHIFEPFIKGFRKAFGIHSPSTVMEEQGGFITAGFLNGIKNSWNSITEFFSNAWGNIKSAASSAWGSIKSAASSAWENIKSSAIGEKVSGIISSAKDMGSDIKENLSDTWDKVKSKASTLWGNIKSEISEKATQMKTAVEDTSKKLSDGLSKTWTDTKTNASKYWQNIKSTVSTTYTNLKSTLDTTSSAIGTAIKNTWNSVDKEAGLSWKSIKSTVTTLWGNLKSEISKTDWSSVGSNLVSGLKSGISNTWASLKSTVSSLASGLTGTLKSIFGIHSPSKVWAEIGRFLGLGLDEGIDGSEKKILSTVSTLADNVDATIASNDAKFNLDIAENGLVSGLSSLTDKLTNIASTFYAISNMLTGVSDLRIPVIASGAEVPYRARMSASDIVSASTTDTEINSRFEDALFILRQILELLQNRKNISKSELEEILRRILGNPRGFGGA